MPTKTKNWSTGSGSATIQYDGQGDDVIIVTSDPNSLYEARSMQIVVETTDGSGISRNVTIQQAAKQRIDISAAVVTATAQTYNGSAKTPTPTVTLNGNTIPSSGYDVVYSDNVNAGTATITVTGKGDYTGTATGTFTINKATPSYTAPATRSLTYSGSSQYLTTSGSTSHGTIYYSTNGVNWYTSRRTATNAGDYDCYWKLVGDANHTDISSTYLGTTTIAKASRSISWSSYPSTLNVGSSATLSASVSAGSGDGSISYSSSNSSRASVRGSTVTGVSSGTCTIYAYVDEGTNYLSASISYTLTVKEHITLSMSDVMNFAFLGLNTDTVGIYSQTPQQFAIVDVSAYHGCYINIKFPVTTSYYATVVFLKQRPVLDQTYNKSDLISSNGYTSSPCPYTNERYISSDTNYVAINTKVGTSSNLVSVYPEGYVEH